MENNELKNESVMEKAVEKVAKKRKSKKKKVVKLAVICALGTIVAGLGIGACVIATNKQVREEVSGVMSLGKQALAQKEKHQLMTEIADCITYNVGVAESIDMLVGQDKYVLSDNELESVDVVFNATISRMAVLMYEVVNSDTLDSNYIKAIKSEVRECRGRTINYLVEKSGFEKGFENAISVNSKVLNEIIDSEKYQSYNTSIGDLMGYFIIDFYEEADRLEGVEITF